MSEKIYIVTLHKKEDLEGFYTEMEDKGFRLNMKRPISRNTQYWMTEEQAVELREDNRVWDVEVLEDLKWQREDNREPYTISGDFGKNSLGGPLVRQWGQVHCAGDDGQRGKGTYGFNDVINTSVDIFDNGEHVDVVICDDPISYDSEEWYSPSKGVSRFVQYQWFNELNTIVNSIDDDGQTEPTGTITYGQNASTAQYHGIHVAGTVAGQFYGWANEANIYNIATTDPWPSGQQVGPLLMFDYLRAFHLNKPINPITGRRNPTISNHSYGGYYEPNGGDPLAFANINYIVYRGVQYNASNPGPSGWTSAGVEVDFNVKYIDKYNAHSTAVAADVADAIEDGVIIVGSAGNRDMHVAKLNDQDWNNIISTTSNTRYYCRGSWPNTDDSGSIVTGSLSNEDDFRKSSFSNFGPGLDIFAPGSYIYSSFGNTGGNDTKYTQGSGNYKGNISGTSMAAPQVAGVLACAASRKERFTQDDARRYLNDTSKYNDMTVDAFGGDYTDPTVGYGGPNKYLIAKNPRVETGMIKPLAGIRKETGQTFPRPKLLANKDSVGEILTNGSVIMRQGFSGPLITYTWSQASTYSYTIDIRVPTSPTTGSFPVAILLHGAGGNGAAEITQWNSYLPGHILIAPTGFNNVWNIVDESDAPDFQFLSDLMVQLEKYKNVQKVNGTAEISMIGISNGAAMGLRMGVEYAGSQLRYVVALVSQLHDQQLRSLTWYKPSDHENTDSSNVNRGYDTAFTPYGVIDRTPIAKGRYYLQINGQNDNIIPYEGGNGPGGAIFNSAIDSLYNLAAYQQMHPSPKQNTFQFHYTPDVNLLLQQYITNRIYDDLIAYHGRYNGLGHSVNNSMRSCVADFIQNNGGIPLSPVGNTYSITVSSQGASNYVFTGSDSSTNHANALDPVITCNTGDTLSFNLNIIGNHPFLIKTTRTTGVGNQVTNPPATNNGANSGTISWTPTVAGTYWYICEYHFGMANTIVVS